MELAGSGPMDIWKHSLLSQRKFGGEPDDYVAVHRFVDQSKLYLYHFKHRLLLHHTFGIELASELLGDFVENSAGRQVLVRDIVAAHCAEDLSGRVPTLYEWLFEADDLLAPHFEPAVLDDEDLGAFVNRPYLRTGLKSSLMLTHSDFGVGLVEQRFGATVAMRWREHLPANARVAKYLSAVAFNHKWMFTPDRRELQWLQENDARVEAGLRLVEKR